MAAGTTPIYTAVPRLSYGATALATANTAYDGTGTVLGIFTAGTNGSFINTVRARSAGTNIATVLRVFINNGSTNATAGNNILIDELTLPATTASQTAQTLIQEVVINKAIPAGYVVNVTVGTTVAAGYYMSCFGGDY